MQPPACPAKALLHHAVRTLETPTQHRSPQVVKRHHAGEARPHTSGLGLSQHACQAGTRQTNMCMQ